MHQRRKILWLYLPFGLNEKRCMCGTEGCFHNWMAVQLCLLACVCEGCSDYIPFPVRFCLETSGHCWATFEVASSALASICIWNELQIPPFVWWGLWELGPWLLSASISPVSPPSLPLNHHIIPRCSSNIPTTFLSRTWCLLSLQLQCLCPSALYSSVPSAQKLSLTILSKIALPWLLSSVPYFIFSLLTTWQNILHSHACLCIDCLPIRMSAPRGCGLISKLCPQQLECCLLYCRYSLNMC